MVRSLITGASGFIGRHLARRLRHAGHEVACLVRATSDTSQLNEAVLDHGDVTEPESLRRILASRRPDVIFHLAGLTKANAAERLFQVNEVGTANLLSAAQHLGTRPTVIVVSTLAAAGPVQDVATAKQESDAARPVSRYGRSKLAAEEMARTFCTELPISIVRPPVVLGPGDRDGLEMFLPIARYGIHAVPGRAPFSLSWIHVEDLAGALLAVAEQGHRLCPSRRGEGVYFAAFPEPVPYADLGRSIGAAIGRSQTRVVRTPKLAVWGIAAWNELLARCSGRPRIMNFDKAREATAGSWICDSGQLTRETGFECDWPLERSLLACAEWYRTVGWLS